MRTRTIVPLACPTCGKQTALLRSNFIRLTPKSNCSHFVVRTAGRSEPLRVQGRDRPRGIMLEPGDANLGWGVRLRPEPPLLLPSIGLAQIVEVMMGELRTQ